MLVYSSVARASKRVPRPQTPQLEDRAKKKKKKKRFLALFFFKSDRLKEGVLFTIGRLFRNVLMAAYIVCVCQGFFFQWFASAS